MIKPDITQYPGFDNKHEIITRPRIISKKEKIGLSSSDKKDESESQLNDKINSLKKELINSLKKELNDCKQYCDILEQENSKLCKQLEEQDWFDAEVYEPPVNVDLLIINDKGIINTARVKSNKTFDIRAIGKGNDIWYSSLPISNIKYWKYATPPEELQNQERVLVVEYAENKRYYGSVLKENLEIAKEYIEKRIKENPTWRFKAITIDFPFLYKE